MKSEPTAVGAVLTILLLAITAVVAGFLATIGATAAGMPTPQSGSFDLRPLVYFIVGTVSAAVLLGPVAAGLCHFMAKKRGSDSSMLVAAASVCLLAFLAGFGCYKGSKIADHRRFEKLQHSRAQQAALYAQIRNDPTVVVRERWFEVQDGRKTAYEQSLSDAAIVYDSETIGELYTSDPAHAAFLLANQSIDEALLAKRFGQALEELTNRNTENSELFAILMNPKAKKEWLQSVAASDALKGEKFPALKLLVNTKLPALGNEAGKSDGRNRR